MRDLRGRVGRFEILGHWDTRRSGEVYAAREAARRPGPDNLYALTLLPDVDVTKKTFEQLRPALRKHTTFLHESYAQHHGVFAHEGRMFVASDFVRGEKLSQVMRAEEAGRSALVAVSISAALARIVHAAHVHEDEEIERGQLVHGDLCPSNVVITYDGRIVITDFGLALAQSQINPERSGLRGHVVYMAPERAASHSDVGPAADVYSMGMMLYEMLAGGPAITGANDAELVAAAMKAEVPPLSSRVRCSASLERLVHSAIEPEPKLRITAEELAESVGHLRSAKLAAWEARQELAKLMERHFAHKARAMRVLEDRWSKKPNTDLRPRRAVSVGQAPLIPLPVAEPPPRVTSALPAAAFVPDLALEAMATDDLPRGEVSTDLPRVVAPAPRPMSLTAGLGIGLMGAGLLTLSTMWWPEAWKSAVLDVPRMVGFVVSLLERSGAL